MLAGFIAAGAVAVVALSGGSSDQGQQTFDATDGPHVVVSALPGVDLTPLRAIPGLTAASGPFPVVDTSLRYRGREVGTRLEGRPVAATVVDHPLLVSGGWARPGTIVLERNTARALDVPLGAQVTVAAARGRIRLTVGGVAETAAPSRSSGTVRGLGYVVPGTMTRVAPKATYGSTMLLRLGRRAGAVSIAKKALGIAVKYELHHAATELIEHIRSDSLQRGRKKEYDRYSKLLEKHTNLFAAETKIKTLTGSIRIYFAHTLFTDQKYRKEDSGVAPGLPVAG